MCFTLEAGHAIGVECEEFRQDLDRDVAIQLGVASAIHLAHPANPQRGQNLVGGDVSSNQRHGAIVFRRGRDERARSDFPGGRDQEISGPVLGSNQPFDVSS